MKNPRKNGWSIDKGEEPRIDNEKNLDFHMKYDNTTPPSENEGIPSDNDEPLEENQTVNAITTKPKTGKKQYNRSKTIQERDNDA
jgi:hypothetical protein